MGEEPMVNDRSSDATQGREQQRDAKNFETRHRIENQSGDSKYVDQDDIDKNCGLAGGRFPERLVPRLDFLHRWVDHSLLLVMNFGTRRFAPAATWFAGNARLEIPLRFFRVWTFLRFGKMRIAVFIKFRFANGVM